jgi:hypothetical protein
MSIDRVHCYIVTCDDCRRQFDETGADYVVHFDTGNEAENYITENGWLITTDGRHLCQRCFIHHLCHHTGHVWGPWIPCHCKGSVPGHHLHGCGLFRLCLRDGCNHHQDTTFADLPTVEEPHAFGC